MKSKKPFVTIKASDFEKFTKGLLEKANFVDRDVQQKINKITTIVYVTARARRPKITVKELKATGAPRYFRHDASTGKMKEYRVSDPNAILGVPVDTGNLQAAIKKSVVKQGGKWVGTVWVEENIPYALAIEYGTSKIKARPFMRPAYNENREFIKKTFEAPITKI